MEVGEFEAYLFCPADVTGMVDRRFVFVKTKEGHLVADGRPYSIMRERMETDYQWSSRRSSSA